MLCAGRATGSIRIIFIDEVYVLNTKDKDRIIANIEKILSEILSDKHEAKITIKFKK